ncbi:hypothetical protein O0L34_g10244 [Tuta absoluta]|nr:hypothetical protein O0L34_g10244 [Tuta absoluta]
MAGTIFRKVGLCFIIFITMRHSVNASRKEMLMNMEEIQKLQSILSLYPYLARSDYQKTYIPDSTKRNSLYFPLETEFKKRKGDHNPDADTVMNPAYPEVYITNSSMNTNKIHKRKGENLLDVLLDRQEPLYNGLFWDYKKK